MSSGPRFFIDRLPAPDGWRGCCISPGSMTTLSSEPDFDAPAGARYHVIVCARSAEADAFVAGLARSIEWPDPSTADRTLGPLEVWSTTPDDDGSVALFLSEAALRAAEAAFPLVPVVGTCVDQARPSDACLVLDGATGRTGERLGFRNAGAGRKPAQSGWSAIRFETSQAFGAST